MARTLPQTVDLLTMATSTSKTSASDTSAASGGCYLFFGTDEYEVSRRCKQKVEELCPPADQALGLETINGACDTIEEAVAAVRACRDALNTVGFFGSPKLVWLRDASFLYDGKPGKFADVKAAVAGLAEEVKRGLLPGVRFVVHASSVDRRTAFYKAMEKGGAVVACDLPDKDYKWDKHAQDVLRGMIAEAKLRASGQVIELIVERAGNQSRQLASELEKLRVYVGDRKEITADDVLQIVSPARERGYGELATAFARRDLPGSLRILRQLLQQKEQPVGLIISLENRIRELLVYRTALARQWLRLYGDEEWPKIDWVSSPEAEDFFAHLANDPRKTNPFWAGKLAQMASGFSLGWLQRIQRQLVEDHGRMTDGTAAADLLLEWSIIKCLGVLRE